MQKTKTKRTIWTILLVVAFVAVAAIFYWWTMQEEPEPIKKVEIQENIEAVENEENSDEQGPREFISEYYKEKDRFNAIGVSWEEINSNPGDITFSIRTKDSGEESQWFDVYGDLVKTEGERSYYAAETPILVRGDEYQYKVTLAKPENQVENIKFDIINTMGTSYLRFIDGIKGLFVKKASAGAWNPSNIISRNTWGGTAVNVSATLWPPSYAEKTTKFVVHHTVSANYSCSTYTQDEAGADVKAIWSYHTYTRDWGDIGYNYLVDPCGRVFEGRLGGNNVIAGHASPYNFWNKTNGDGYIDEASIGVSVMGDYSYLVPNSNIIESLGRVMGYKSYLNGINPYGTSYFVDKTTYNIAGHRDYTSTACPGAALYAKLASIRYSANAHKKLYITDYGSWEPTANNIYLNSARVSMEDVSTPEAGDYVLAENPAIGEPITMLSAIKNNNTSPVTLYNLKVIGILDSGTKFTIGQSATFTIGAGQIESLPNAEYNISSFRYQSYRITYELSMQNGSGSTITINREPVISTSYRYPSIIPHFPSLSSPSGLVLSASQVTEGSNLTITADIKNNDSRPAYIYDFGPSENIGFTADDYNNPPIYQNETKTYSKTLPADNPGVYTIGMNFKYGNNTQSNLSNISSGVTTIRPLTILPTSVNYSNIYLNSFRATLEDGKLVSQSLSPSVGEPITISASLKNNNPYPVSLSNVKLIGILDGTPFTIGTQSSMILPEYSVVSISADNNNYQISSTKDCTFKIEYTGGGITRNPTLSSTYSYQSFSPHRPVVKIIYGPASSPSSPIINSEATLSFKLRNYDSRPAYVDNVYLNINNGATNTKLKNVSPVKINVASEYSYSDTRTFSSIGTISLSAYLSYWNNRLLPVQAVDIDNIPVTTSAQVVSEPINYGNISLNSFRVSMEDVTTSEEGDYILADTPAIGEPVTVLATLKNSNSYPVTLSNVRIRGVLDSGTQFTIGIMPSITIQANGATAAVDPKSFNITSSRTHTFYLDFEADGKTVRPYVKSTYEYQKITAHFPNVKIVKTPVFTPTVPLVYDNVYGVYKLKNYDARPAYMREITMLAKLNNSIPYYFPKVTRKIAPGEVYLYSRDIIPANGGLYYANAEMTYGNGTTTIPKPVTGINAYSKFRVYVELASLDGYNIPSTYGKVAVEQHLYLNKQEYDYDHDSISTTDSAKLHYQNSLVDLLFPGVSSIKNGMAGGFGAFGAYYDCRVDDPDFDSCQMPVTDERYYITMRWSYVTWYEAPDGTCTTKLDGRLDTCTKDYSSTKQLWHKQRRVVVTNPKNGKKIVASVLEAGPAIWTGRVAGLSPEAMYALGASTNDYLKYYWAASNEMPLGLLN